MEMYQFINCFFCLFPGERHTHALHQPSFISSVLIAERPIKNYYSHLKLPFSFLSSSCFLCSQDFWVAWAEQWLKNKQTWHLFISLTLNKWAAYVGMLWAAVTNCAPRYACNYKFSVVDSSVLQCLRWGVVRYLYASCTVWDLALPLLNTKGIGPCWPIYF